MRNNKKEIENSSLNSTDNKLSPFLLDMIEQNKAKKKFYYLYKNGSRYIVKKKKIKNIV